MKVARSRHSKVITWVERIRNSSQGQRSRSNITNFQTLLVFTMVRTPTKSHQFQMQQFLRLSADRHTDRQTSAKTIPAGAQRTKCRQTDSGWTDTRIFSILLWYLLLSWLRDSVVHVGIRTREENNFRIKCTMSHVYSATVRYKTACY